MFKNQIKSLLAHRVYVSVARHRERPVLSLNRDGISCGSQGLAKRPPAGTTNPGTACASVSRLQLLPYGSHSLLWMCLVLEGQFAILYGVYPSSEPQSSLPLRLQYQAQRRKPNQAPVFS